MLSRARHCPLRFLTHTRGCRGLRSDTETYFWALSRCLCLPACLCVICLQQPHSSHPSPSLFLCFAKFFFRFLHDKNSREFLYYRKKVAEIRKEAQKLQTASQKGRWVGGVGGSGEARGQTAPHVESSSWWHGVALTAEVCALPGAGVSCGCYHLPLQCSGK